MYLKISNKIKCYIWNDQLLKRVILHLNSSVLLAQLCNIFQYCPALLDVYWIIYTQLASTWWILENIGPTAMAMHKISSSNIAHPVSRKLNLISCFSLYGSKLSGWEICTYCVTFWQISLWPGVQICHQRAKKKIPSWQVHQRE